MSIDWVVATVSFFTQGVVALIFGVVAASLYGVVVWRGQADFNAYLRATGGEPVERAHAVEIVALAICALFAIGWVYVVLHPF